MSVADSPPVQQGLVTRLLETVRSHVSGPLGKGAFFLSLNQGIVSGLGLVFWLMATRSYAPEAVGRATSLIAAGVFLSFFSTLGLHYALIRNLAASAEPRKLAAAVIRTTGLVGLAIGGLGALVLSVISPAFAFVREDPLIPAAMAAFVASFTIMMVFEQVLVAARKSERSTIMLSIFGALRLFGPLLAPGGTALALLATWAIAMVVAVAFTAVAILPAALSAIPNDREGSAPRIRPLLRFAALNHLATLLSMAGPLLLPATFLIALPGADGPRASAVFYVAYQIASILFVVPIALALVQFAEGSRAPHESRSHERQALRLAFAVTAPAGALLLVLAPSILSFFGPSYAVEGTDLLRALTLAAFAVVPTTVMAARYRLSGNLRPAIAAFGAASGATLLGSVALVPTVGLWGAGLAFLIGQALGALILVSNPEAHSRGGAAAD